MRTDGRRPDEIRNVHFHLNYLTAPHGSCLIEMGKTRVVCSVMVEESVPPFLKGKGKGWLTAEYAMLPGSSSHRVPRERQKISGRSHEIQRLIGRSLRMCVELSLMGERSFLIDCDVLDADGGTRTAAITGSYVALALAVRRLEKEKLLSRNILKGSVAAISVGIVKGVPCLDLHYDDDKDAEVDMNIVKTSAGQYVEIQGTAENAPFDNVALQKLLQLADTGIQQLLQAQRLVLTQ